MSGIVVVILIVLIGYIWSTIVVRDKKRKTAEKEEAIAKCKKDYNQKIYEFIERYRNDEVLSKSGWYDGALAELKYFVKPINNEVYGNIDTQLNEARKLQMYIVEKIVKYDSNSANVRGKILENIEYFKSLKNGNMPKFFVIQPILANEVIYDDFYFSNNLTIDDNLTIKGVCFIDEKKEGEYITISPYDWTMREMTKDEFETIYLPNRLTSMRFDSDVSASLYEDYLRTMFYEK